MNRGRIRTRRGIDQDREQNPPPSPPLPPVDPNPLCGMIPIHSVADPGPVIDDIATTVAKDTIAAAVSCSS